MWWKKKCKRVAFVDRSENGVTGEASLRGPINGRLTCLHNVTKYLAGRGHQIEVLGRHPRFTTEAGVLWNDRWQGSYDTLVFLRGLGDGEPAIDAGKRILWVRDLPHSGFCSEPGKLKSVQVVALSKYAERIWRSYYRQIKKCVVIPNGVDTRVFKRGPISARNRKLFLFASNPNRGLDRLPLIFESVHAVDPEIQMVAFSDRETLHPGETGDYADATRKCVDKGIDVRAPVSAERLAWWMQTAGAMVLPSDYPEICSNVVLQALACGLPIITTGRMGATVEWVKDGVNGRLTQFDKRDYQIYDLEIARHMLDLAKKPAEWASLCYGAEDTDVPSWEDIGRKWERLI